MPIVIQSQRYPSGWEIAGQNIQQSVEKYLLSGMQMAKQQQDHARSMASLGMTAAQLQRQARADAVIQRKEADRETAMAQYGSIDFTSPDAAQHLLKVAPFAPEFVGSALKYIQQEKQFEASELARRASESRYYESLNKPQYDMTRGGLVHRDGRFQPLKMPEGYVPPERMPQKSYTDLVKEAYATASTVPEEQRTDEQKRAIALGQTYGIKPQGSGELEVLPIDTAARKEAFELRNQWDEADRVQRTLDAFEAGGGQGGTGLFLGMLPTTLANRIDPGGTDLRAGISQMSSVIMNALSGAAVTEQERKRLEGFLLTASDDLPTVRRKLAGYRDYVSTKTDSWRKMYGETRPLADIQKQGGIRSDNQVPDLPPGFKVVVQ